jgi:hypothetical protein
MRDNSAVPIEPLRVGMADLFLSGIGLSPARLQSRVCSPGRHGPESFGCEAALHRPSLRTRAPAWSPSEIASSIVAKLWQRLSPRRMLVVSLPHKHISTPGTAIGSTDKIAIAKVTWEVRLLLQTCPFTAQAFIYATCQASSPAILRNAFFAATTAFART